MIKKLLLLVLGIFPLMLTAQVIINAQLPPGGFVQKDQLWNLILINNKQDFFDVRIKLSLQDAVTGQEILSATSTNFVLNKGVKVMTSREAQPVMYNSNAISIAKNYLPIGTYVACYQVVDLVQKGLPLSEDCIRINIDPLSPPLLNTPSDKAQLPTPYPQFTWMPPTPFDMFTELSYDMVVTEVLPKQAPAEAMEYNTPIYTKSNIAQPYESYTSSFSKLDTGKVYAWQVIARNGATYAAKTAVWTFTIATPAAVSSVVAQTGFIKMKKNDPGKGMLLNGVLKLSYVNETTDNTATITILDLSDQDKMAPQFKVDLKPGENLIEYNLKKLFSLQQGKVYQAVLTNSRNEQWSMQFESHDFNGKKITRN